MVRVGIVVDFVREEEKRLLSAFRSLGCEAEYINVREAAIDVASRWDSFDIFVIRTVSHRRGLTIAEVLDAHGMTVVNPLSSLYATWSKPRTIALLAARGIPVPRSYLVLGGAEPPLQDQIIVKPVSGSWGRRVALIRRSEWRALMSQGDPEEPLLAQERIGVGVDARVFVVKGEVVGAMLREPPDGEWRSNVARGGRTRPLTIDAQLADYVVKAVDAVGAIYAGVDVLIDSTGRYVINEVNGVPEFKALSQTINIDVAKIVAEAVFELAKR